jgi:hypothetical protein
MGDTVTAGEKGKGLWVAEEVMQEILVWTLTGPPVLDAVVVDSGEAPATESEPLPDSVAQAMAIGLTHGLGMRLLCQCCQREWPLRPNVAAMPLEEWLWCKTCGPLRHAPARNRGGRNTQKQNVRKGGALMRCVPLDCRGAPHHNC